MIKLGSNSIGKIYLGSNSIGKAYLGSNLVFQRGGPSPSGDLVFYDRLVFDGTAYIDTDIVPDSDYSYRMYIENESQKIPQRYFFVPTANSGFTGVTLNSSTTTTTRHFSAYYGSTSSLSSDRTLNFTTESFTLFLTPKRFGYDSTGVGISKGSNAPNGPLVIGQSSTHNGQAFTGRMSWFRIYGSDAQNSLNVSDLNSYTPIYTLRPCTYQEEPGLWCVETETFYGNTAGAGTLSVMNNS